MRRSFGIWILWAVAAGLASPAVAEGQTPLPAGTETILVKGGPELQVIPMVSDSLIAFVERTEVSGEVVIWYRDLAAGSELKMIPTVADVRDVLLGVSGTRILFERRAMASPERSTLLFDTASQTLTELVPPSADTTRTIRGYALAGENVALLQSSTSPLEFNVGVLSVNDQTITWLTHESATERQNGIHGVSLGSDGNSLAWQRCEVVPGSGVSCTMRLSRKDADGNWGPGEIVAEGAHGMQGFDADGSLVAWSAVNGDSFDLQYRYFPDGALTTVEMPESWEGLPRVSGPFVAFNQSQHSITSRDLYVLDTRSGALYAVTNTAEREEYLSDLHYDETSGDLWLGWNTSSVNEQDVDAWVMRIPFGARHTVRPLFRHEHAYRQGAVVPIRLQLLDATGVNVSSSSLVLTATGLVHKDSTAAPLVVEDAGNSNPDDTFRYDAALQGYAFNLSAKGLASGTWELRFRAGANSREYAITFDVR